MHRLINKHTTFLQHVYGYTVDRTLWNRSRHRGIEEGGKVL